MTNPFTQYRHLYGRWCSWETEVHRQDGTTYPRTEYGIILPDDENASQGLLTVMELMPDQVAIDYDVDPDTITILHDVAPAFYGGWESWTHPADRTAPREDTDQ